MAKADKDAQPKCPDCAASKVRVGRLLGMIETIQERYEARGETIKSMRATIPMLTTTTRRGQRAFYLMKESLHVLANLEKKQDEKAKADKEKRDKEA